MRDSDNRQDLTALNPLFLNGNRKNSKDHGNRRPPEVEHILRKSVIYCARVKGLSTGIKPIKIVITSS